MRSGSPAHSICKSFTHPSAYQIFTYVFFILQNYLFETHQEWLSDWSISTLILVIWHYILIFFMVFELILVTTGDTRDPILGMGKSEDDFHPSDLRFCVLCNSIVLNSSYHCWRCNQCTSNIDHHCKFLNCCIADENYYPFLRLLAVFIFYSTDFLFLVFKQESFSAIIWIVVVGTSFQLLFTIVLFMFHIYLGQFYSGSTKNFCLRTRVNKSKPVELQEETYNFK